MRNFLKTLYIIISVAIYFFICGLPFIFDWGWTTWGETWWIIGSIFITSPILLYMIWCLSHLIFATADEFCTGIKHDWDGCKCKRKRCGNTRIVEDYQHDWRTYGDGKCKECKRCGKNTHDWKDCECRICGAPRGHDWQYFGSSSLRQRCRRCGEEINRCDWHDWVEDGDYGGGGFYTSCRKCGIGKPPD